MFQSEQVVAEAEMLTARAADDTGRWRIPTGASHRVADRAAVLSPGVDDFPPPPAVPASDKLGWRPYADSSLAVSRRLRRTLSNLALLVGLALVLSAIVAAGLVGLQVTRAVAESPVAAASAMP